jgi:hypothetical protein
MLTDDEIKTIRDMLELGVYQVGPNQGIELCARLLSAEAKVSELQGALSLWIGSDNTAASAARDDRQILVQQRDEARALVETLDDENEAVTNQVEELIGGINDAEARGYERGVQEAAALAEHWLGPDSYCQAAILALLEKPTS